MAGERLKGKSVLLVEDEFLVAMMVEGFLADAGCSVFGPFNRVPEAIEAAQTLNIDVAVLDVNIAGERVYPVAHVLERRGIPFILVSGYGEDAIPRDRPHWEACSKPFNPPELMAALERKLR